MILIPAENVRNVVVSGRSAFPSMSGGRTFYSRSDHSTNRISKRPDPVGRIVIVVCLEADGNASCTKHPEDSTRSGEHSLGDSMASCSKNEWTHICGISTET